MTFFTISGFGPCWAGGALAAPWAPLLAPELPLRFEEGFWLDDEFGLEDEFAVAGVEVLPELLEPPLDAPPEPEPGGRTPLPVPLPVPDEGDPLPESCDSVWALFFLTSGRFFLAFADFVLLWSDAADESPVFPFSLAETAEPLSTCIDSAKSPSKTSTNAKRKRDMTPPAA